jgi:hypothetical protein
VIRSIPDLPVHSEFQNAGTSFPTGVTTPKPVITTLRDIVCLLTLSNKRIEFSDFSYQ